MMHVDIWVVPNSNGFPRSIKLVLQFQQQPLTPVSELGADDDDVNRAVTRKLLEKLGCNVTSVSFGIQCLSSLSNSGTHYQLVILDLHMPQMNGFKFAMRIRKLRSRSWPAIVALTASAEEQSCSKPWQMSYIESFTIRRTGMIYNYIRFWLMHKYTDSV